MYRLGHMVDGEEVAHSHAPTFRRFDADARKPRIVLGVPDGDPNVLLDLARCLEEPLFVLYILHTPRGEAEAGRYQSTELTHRDVASFVEDFRPFLAGDGRFDLWVYSPSQKATLAWDRHNLLFAYGPLDCYETTLRAAGFTEGEPVIPAPHAHHYRPELDALAGALIARFDWLVSPLRPEDEQ